MKVLKNSTQQKRVELIETQKWELIAATATIDNQAATINDLEKTMAKMEKFRLDTIKQNDELSTTCGNLVRTKMRNESAIKDLTKRNGNLTRITNDQTERIEVMQHELKNYESAIEVLEVKEARINELYLAYEKRNQELMSKATESRERLASKFTNWFIFLVFTNVVSIAWGVYQLLTK